ncbi:MAG TPA: glycoside hydrolase family 3 N-terminal domain-containing protein [Bacteroidales bacterium]|nr:glycoside hydrolase family 3 N-terminal domain-containing protein [Bacteroidales bacterium]
MKNISKVCGLLMLIALAGTFRQASGQNPGSSQSDPDSIRIEALISRMTLEEKIGQLSLFTSDWTVTGPSLNPDYKNLVRQGKAGAIFNAYTVDFIKELQRTAVEESRLKIPLIFGYDVIHGHRTIFPIPLGQAASWDLEAIEHSCQIAATEASAEGLDWTFAPMVDITRDPRWGRVSEGSGEDTWLGSKISAVRVQGFQGTRLKDPHTVMACVKHFAAYGAPQGGRDYNIVDLSELSLYETYLPPYKAAVEAGVGSVMTSFNEINGMPSTANRWLLTDLLRNQWGFKGFVVTDYTSINELVPHGVAGTLKDAAALALNAGVDMDMQGSAYLSSLGDLVNSGQVTVDQIDADVRRILKAKFELGLFDDPYRGITREREQTEIMTPEDLAFARKFVSESCVLLKNDHHTLPIPATVKTLAVIGPLANSKRDMLGNWSAAGNADKCVTLLEGIRNRFGDKLSILYEKGCGINDSLTNGFNAAITAADKADFVILALGESEGMSGEAASRSIIGLPGMQEELAERVIQSGKPSVVVLFNGRPLVLSRLDQLAPAILETWFGGTEAGNGIADILSGDYNPSGKLTMSFPRDEGQIPVYYNMKNTGRPFDPAHPGEKYVSRYLDVPNSPLYPFGYGLSYTSFTYSNLTVTVSGNDILVTADVTNKGDQDGTEVAQLYIRDMVGSITRPLRELKGFQRILIKKGETAHLSFRLTKDDLAFFHPDLKKYWEPGEFTAYVGGNSDATLAKTFRIK